MGVVLSDFTGSKDNNFNLIRFAAASLVLFTHSYALVGLAEPLEAALGMTLGKVAVDIFFITSGFLVTCSFLQRDNLLAFIWARVLRVYPALIIAVIFCVFIVGWYFTVYPAFEYFSDSHTLKYLKRNVTLFNGVRYDLPGVFVDNPYKETVNGSLWTLPYEIKMYSYLAGIFLIIGVFRKRFGHQNHKIIFGCIGLAALLVDGFNHFYLFVSANATHLFLMFFLGAAFYIYKEVVVLSARFFALIVLLTGVSLFLHKGLFFILYSISLPYLIFYLAYVPEGFVRTFNGAGDYSYGIYIYAFPVQQSLVSMIPGISVGNVVMLSFCVTFVLAFISWHLIEKKCLKLKNRYIGFDQLVRNMYQKAVLSCRNIFG